VVAESLKRTVWTKDAAGYVSYMAYDLATGAVIKTIADVDTTQTGTFANLPSGWSTPGGGGLHITSTLEGDNLGRPTKSTDPNGNISYVIYDDASHETRIYAGWTGSATTGPTVVVREDRARGYSETLTMTATPTTSGSRPTGAESISGVQTLSRQVVSAGGQVVESRRYFDLTSLSYTDSLALGASGTNYYSTDIAYSNRGWQNKVVTPTGTIYRTEYDGLGRVVSQWVGTDDAPTTGY